MTNAPTPALPSNVEELRAALERIRRTPAKPFPDPGAHSARAFGDAVWRAWSDIQRIATEALAATSYSPLRASTQKEKPFLGENPYDHVTRNARVQNHYDELMRAGKHGHYETMFRIVKEEVDRARSASVTPAFSKKFECPSCHAEYGITAHNDQIYFDPICTPPRSANALVSLPQQNFLSRQSPAPQWRYQPEQLVSGTPRGLNMSNTVTLESEPKDWLELAWTEFDSPEATDTVVARTQAERALRMMAEHCRALASTPKASDHAPARAESVTQQDSLTEAGNG